MNWIESIREAISYIEEHITEDLSIKEDFHLTAVRYCLLRKK